MPRKLKNLFIKNNPHGPAKQSLVVYRYTGKHQEGQFPDISYIGYTECALQDRCRNHAQNGTILQHSIEKHNTRMSTKEILEHMEVLCHFNSKEELTIAEALFIKKEAPVPNGQREGENRILLIF